MSTSDLKLVFTADGSQLEHEVGKAEHAVQNFGKSSGHTAEKMGHVSREAKGLGTHIGELAFVMQSGEVKAEALTSSLAAMAADSARLQSRFPALAANAFAVAGAIGALVGVFGSLVQAIKKFKAELPEGTVSDLQKKHIENLKTQKQVQDEILRTDGLIAAAQSKLGRGDDDSQAAHTLENLYAKRNALSDRAREIEHDASEKRKRDAEAAARKEKARQEELARQRAADAIRANDMQQQLATALFGTLGKLRDDDYAAQRAQIQREHDDRVHAINELKVSEQRRKELIQQSYDIRKAELDLAAKEREQRRASMRDEVLAGGSDPVAAHAANLRMIERERDAYVKATGDKATAEQMAQQKIRQMRVEAQQAVLANLRTIEEVTIGSSNRELQAIGKAAQTYRKLKLGVLAAEEGVEAVKEGAHAIGAAARYDFGAAALYAASSLKHAAAAAMAAKEAGGGGAGGAGGGGSAGGGGTQRESTRVAGSLGASSSDGIIRQEIVVVLKDQNDKELVRTRARYQRLDDRNQPIRMGV